MFSKQKILPYLKLFSLLIVLFLTGILAGMNYEKYSQKENREPIAFGDFSDEISLLHFEKIENGVLYGRLEGEEARIVVEGKETIDSRAV